jgi:DNA-binding SARP family transcriptional activator
MSEPRAALHDDRRTTAMAPPPRSQPIPPRVEPLPAGSPDEPTQATAVGVPRIVGLHRERLTQRLDALPAQRLGLVVAPAGSGKTALMADWSASTGLDVAWCRITRSDCADSLLRRISREWGLADVHPDEVDRLVAQLAVRDRGSVLVLDDADLIAPGPAWTTIETLARSLPPGASMLLGARRRPELDLVHSEVSVNPVVLGPDDLRFRSWEVEALFRDVYGEPLLPDDAAALARHTSGWAAALHLFHLSTTGQPAAARRRAVQSLAGRNRYARGYLSKQVLVGLGPHRSEFLRRTAVFDVLSGPRCDALLERDDSQRILWDLVAQQALTSTDDDGATFRYHEVLRRHLETELEAELGEAGLRDWYVRAAELLEAEGALTEALRVRARCKDWSGMRSLLLRTGWQVNSLESSWMGLLPTSILHGDPSLGLAQAQRLLGDGLLEAATTSAQDALAQLDDPRADDRAREVLAVARAWQQLECPPTHRWYEQLAEGLRSLRPWTRRALDDTPRDSTQDALARPFLLLLSGNADGALDALPHARALAAESSPAATALSLLEGVAAMLNGDPRAFRVADAVATAAELDDLGWFTRASRALLAATDDDPGRGRQDPLTVRDACLRRGDAWGAAWASLLAALRGVCDDAGDVEVLDEAAQQLGMLGANVPEAWARSLAALVAARAGDGDASERARSAEARAKDVSCPAAQALAIAAHAWALGDPARLRSAHALANDTSTTFMPWQTWDFDESHGRVDTAPVTLTLLGRFEMVVGEARPALGEARPQVRQLLRVLALHAGEAMHREQLAELMWPDQTSRDAIHRLQVAISQLRQTLAPTAAGPDPLIERDGECYRLCLPEGSRVDVLEFREAMRRARLCHRTGQQQDEVVALQEALERYGGDLLPEEGPAEWVVQQREQLRTEASQAATALAALIAPTDPRAAVTAAERALGIDAYNDAAWHHLIALHVALGDIAQAERARASYADVLRELGIDTDAAARHTGWPGPLPPERGGPSLV